MVDDDVTYHVKQQPASKINVGVQSLITRERMQKLDLLIHLLSNLPQALVVCGPEGIGKTTLLNILQQRKTESWRYCPIQGTSALSFEVVHRQIVICMSQDRSFVSTGSLSADFQQYENLHKQIVVIVDNAGELVPGLITTLIQYAAATPALKIVFALSHDELQLKRGSDRAVDDCHIIEIPPLTVKQCGDFLQDLSARPNANLSFSAISENMIEHIYRETHGIPGKIISEISDLPVAKQSGKMKWIIAVAIAVALAAAVSVQWLLSSKQDKAPENQQVSNSQAIAQQPEPQVIPAPVQPVTQQQNASLPAVAATEPLKSSDESNVPNASQQPAVSTPKTEMPGAAEVAQKLDGTQPQYVTSNVAEPVVAQPAPALEKPQQLDVIKPANNRTQLTNSDQQANKVQASAVPSSSIPKPAEVPVAQQTLIPQPASRQEKPKQSEPVKTVSDMQLPNAGQPANKVPTAPVPPSAPVLKPVEAPIAPQQPVVQQQIVVEQAGNRQEQPKPVEIAQAANPINSVQPFVPSNTLETIQLPQKPVDIAPAQPAAEAVAPQQIRSEQTLPSPENNFTLQLMVLSKQSSANEMVRKYPAMAPDFRVVNTFANGRPKFILEYGAYPDAATANKARQSLPFEFRNALVRKINK